MNTTARLAAYGTAVVLFGTGAFAIGSATNVPTGHLRPAAEAAGDHGAMDMPGPAQQAPATIPSGLSSSQGGFSVVPTTTNLPSGRPTEIAYRITGPDGSPVTRFDVSHDKQMHLIVVRSDTADFQHLHPTMSPDGTWRAPVTLAAGGTYRAFADFQPTGGAARTLGVDLFASGDFTPISPAPSRTSTAPGGYEVTLHGDLTPGRTSDVALSVTRNGEPVTDLQPYLGAYGHLVALRTGDLGYLHVHPHGEPGDGTTRPGPEITFSAEVPTTGTYRLFLDFQHEGQVRTAEFTVPTTGEAPAPGPVHTEGGHR